MLRIVCTPLILLFTAACSSGEPGSSALEVGVDPRIELLSVVQTLGVETGRRGLLGTAETPYRQGVLAHFGAYSDHGAVSCVDSLVASGFTFDAPHHLFVHLSDPPELEPMTPVPAAVMQRAPDEESLRSCLERIRSFALETRFDSFFAAHEATYDSMAAETRRIAGARNWVGELERYVGESRAGYHVILAPLLAGNFGPRAELEDGVHVYGILSPLGVRDSLPWFATETRLRDLVWHEFGHSFVNPLTARHSEAVDSTGSLLEPIREVMRRRGYGNWKTVVDEHVIRAVTARLRRAHFGAEDGRLAVLAEVASGFAYVDTLASALAHYEQDRDQYPSLADYYSDLMGLLADLARTDLGPEYFSRPFVGPMNAVGRDSSLLVVLPTNESDAGDQSAIHDYVRPFAARFFPQGRVIMDTTALAMDLSRHEIIAYGTPDGNLLIARVIEGIPLEVAGTFVQATERHADEQLRVFTVWPNPWNRDLGMMLYTAQRSRDLPGVHSVRHGGTDYLVARGTNVIETGNYNDKFVGEWRLPIEPE